MRRLVPVVGLLLVAGLFAGCASDVPESEPTRPADALTWTTEVDEEVDGLPIAVGSQSRPVDLLLGWIATETLVAAGADVTDDLNLGDTQTTRDAQLAGLIDLYWETTGTGWLALLREIGPSADPEQLYEDVRDEDLEENGIVWLPPAPADTGVGIVASPAVIEDRGIVDLSALAAALEDPDEGLKVCVSAVDQPLDSSGLSALADAADVRIRPRLVNPVSPSEIIELTEEGTFCPFALVDRLNVRLADADVTFLNDDLGAFVAEQPSVTIREDTYDMASGLDELFAPVAAALDIDTLRDLVARIIEDDEDPRTVAREWLVEEDLAED
ncbi:MAG: glycine betaine ABC transporter substrate-binding protein [Acidimicrobiales bacterium]